MPARSHQCQGEPSWSVRLAQRLWAFLGSLGSVVVLGLLLNVVATWLTSSQGQLPKDSPFAGISGWVGMHWPLDLSSACLLLIAAVLLRLVSQERLTLPHLSSPTWGALHRYRKYFRYEHRDLDMKGISTRGTYTLDVEQVYVELRIDPTPAHRALSDPLQLPATLAAGTHAIWEYLTQLDQHLVILGAPGSGKTTLLKDLGLRLAQRRSPRRLRWQMPVLLSLREQSTQLERHPQYDLCDAICWQIEKWKQPLAPEWVARMLRKGRCLLLLDGFDEVA